MPKLRVVSGKELVSYFEKLGFGVVAQKGSHIKLGRVVDEEKQSMTIPNHKEIDRGTLRSIYKKSLLYISESDLKEMFYTE